MRVKTSELIGAALDWVVAKCEGYTDGAAYDGPTDLYFSTDWELAGPIIEREGIDLYQSGSWAAEVGGANRQEGRTSLVAAMRCFVASKLGDSVEIPAEFIKG